MFLDLIFRIKDFQRRGEGKKLLLTKNEPKEDQKSDLETLEFVL